jgi:NAD(P)-dependent dehydrogenase (short-subunit alcohol dehydrogenase family)
MQPVILITGVSSGIGRATAELFAARRWRAFGTVRKPGSAPAGVELLTLDVRDEAAVQACVNAAMRSGGRIDALVNNAGVALHGAVEETSADEVKALFETNFFGVVRMTRALLPIMRDQHGGRIATIGSVAGFVPLPYEAAYVAAKHALEGWVESLWYEVKQFGIYPTLIEPGFIRTDLARNVATARDKIAAYDGDRRRSEAFFARSFAQADYPELVAQTVWKAVTSTRPHLRYPVGRHASRLRLLRNLLPQSVFATGMRRRM